MMNRDKEAEDSQKERSWNNNKNYMNFDINFFYGAFFFLLFVFNIHKY
jgi:hypothetical protein